MAAMTTTGLIGDLVQLMARDGLRVEDVVASVGPVSADPGHPVPLRLRATMTGVASATLARDPDDGGPASLELGLAPSAGLRLASLRELLGDHTEAQTDRELPRRFVFPPPPTETGWHVTVMADIPRGASLETAAVSSVTFRRDPGRGAAEAG
jgi:hypothetical protein